MIGVSLVVNDDRGYANVAWLVFFRFKCWAMYLLCFICFSFFLVVLLVVCDVLLAVILFENNLIFLFKKIIK